MSKDYSGMNKEQLINTIERADSILKVKKRIDGWSNIFTGAGIENRDRRVSGQYSPSYIVQVNELTNLYRGDGIASRLIDLPVHDMTRKWFKVLHDVEDDIQKELRLLRVKRNIKEALTWADLYGGAIIVMGIDDGGKLEDELNEESMKKIEFLRVYDRHRINLSTSDLYQEPEHPKFGQVEFYNINPLLGLTGAEPFKVHETRVLRFTGKTMPEQVMYTQEWWGDSRVQNVYERIRGLSMSYANIERIIEEFIIGIIKMVGLEEKLEGGRDKEVINRLNILDMSKHILNSYLLDEDESMERVSAQVNGLSDAVTKLEMALASSSGIPTSIFFGTSPKGLNASGAESQQRDRYYEMIAGRQEEKLLDPVERIVYLVQKLGEGPTKGIEIENWSIEFNPIAVPSMKELAEIHKIQSEADKIDIDDGVLYPSEVTMSRHGGMEYSVETTISEAHLTEIEVTEKAIEQAARSGVLTAPILDPDGQKNKDPDKEVKEEDDNE